MVAQSHVTVLLREAVEALQIKLDGFYVDGTYGRGGHSALILEALGPQGRLMVFDKDPQAIADAKEKYTNDERVIIRHGSFADLSEAINAAGGEANGVLLDLGVSSPQLDQAERGFSFSSNGPLDMRMNPEDGLSVSEWLMRAEEKDISEVVRDYGEERFHRRVAKAIVLKREEEVIETTKQLADLVSEAVPTREKGKHPATRTFQALRIYINRELEDLGEVLDQTVGVLAPQGRLVVISFHSLEDRMVKRFIRDKSTVGHLPPQVAVVPDSMKPVFKKVGGAIKPSKDEVNANPRSRSAVMRVGEKL